MLVLMDSLQKELSVTLNVAVKIMFTKLSFIIQIYTVDLETKCFKKIAVWERI